MKKIFAVAIAFNTIVLFSACGGTDSPEKDTSIMPTEKAAPVMQATDSNPAVNNVPLINPVPNAANAETISASEAANIAPAAGLNPAHGQPGHRCDISVGAPLNSAAAPVKTMNAPAAVTSSPAITSAPVAPVTTAPPVNNNGGTVKLNPAHGQPGHDCAVQVGAPLKN